MPETPVTAIWNDTFTSLTGKCKISAPIERVVQRLGDDIVKKVNENFLLEPPLTANDVLYQYHPANHEPTADIQSVGSDGLILLARPSDQQFDRVRLSWDSMRKENEELKVLKGISIFCVANSSDTIGMDR
jgi:hypothetical protein